MNEQEMKETSTALRRMGDALKKEAPAGTGFILLIFPFGESKGRANYISTAQREDAIKFLRETAYRLERRQDEGSMS